MIISLSCGFTKNDIGEKIIICEVKSKEDLRLRGEIYLLRVTQVAHQILQVMQPQ